MSVNEYVTKFTRLSRYAPHEVDTDEKKQECFINSLNDGLAYALEARDFENFQGMVNKALVLENHRGVMERKRKMVHQYQSSSSSRPCVATSSARPVFHPASHNFSQGHRQLDKDSLPRSVKWFSAPTISRLLLLGIRVFREPKIPKIHSKLIVDATTVVKRTLRQPMPQFAHSCQLARYSYTCPYPWSQLYSYCCQAELCPWESQSCGRGRSARSS
jgi:hypothetical protein